MKRGKKGKGEMAKWGVRRFPPFERLIKGEEGKRRSEAEELSVFPVRLFPLSPFRPSFKGGS
jgi:hypothetical protein